MEQFGNAWENLVEKLEGWLFAIILGLPNFILAAVFMTAGIFFSRYLRRYVSKLIRRLTKEQTIIDVLSNVITIAFLLITLFITLGILNLDKALTSLLAGAGVVGLAVGLALQDPLVNLFSGVMMSVKKYYNIGDLVETNGFLGNITEINLRTTILLRPDGQEVILPNKDVMQTSLINYSHNGWRRIEIQCGISYGDDLEKVKRVAVNAIEETFELTRPAELYFSEFGDSSINFVLWYWQNVTSQREYLDRLDRGIIALKKSFDENDITIPFPIRTLDFGIVGRDRLDDLYPLQHFKNNN